MHALPNENYMFVVYIQQKALLLSYTYQSITTHIHTHIYTLTQTFYSNEIRSRSISRFILNISIHEIQNIKKQQRVLCKMFLFSRVCLMQTMNIFM